VLFGGYANSNHILVAIVVMVNPPAVTAKVPTTCAGQIAMPKRNVAKMHYFQVKHARSTSAAVSSDFAEQPMISAVPGVSRAVTSRLQGLQKVMSSSESLDTTRTGQGIEPAVA
jgi:hypothetical protein